ncbi:NADPH-dependent FMN reductase [Paenibacillus cineris]|uniref:NADPH-dependent FMN reductase n=1 Tax=Paenibacillus cineris TaxID=237530 RepID=UPI001B2DAB84|nr:NADPH-dependent FMN reductase [Paenibacillus cineris]GIO59756.1 FMN reductase (NADPH) [Paenibacillus cineris]
MSKIAIISGSLNHKSRVNGMINYAKQKLEQQGCEVAIIDVSSLPPADLMHANFNSRLILSAHAKVEEASGIIIASPVYKTTYTGVLKAYVDLLPQNGFKDKIVAAFFVGGTISNLLSIDYALKPLLASMGTKSFAENVFAIDSQIERIEDSEQNTGFQLADEIQQRIDASMLDLVSYTKCI